jgi:hypothetical protein
MILAPVKKEKHQPSALQILGQVASVVERWWKHSALEMLTLVPIVCLADWGRSCIPVAIQYDRIM